MTEHATSSTSMQISGFCSVCSWPDSTPPIYKFHPDGICREFPALVHVDWNSFGRLGKDEDCHGSVRWSRPVIEGERVLCISDYAPDEYPNSGMVSWGIVTEVREGYITVRHSSETCIFEDHRDNGIAYLKGEVKP